MVTLTKIYTRSGDGGDTALTGGARRPKNDPRVAAYGTVDEANAAIGLVRLYCREEAGVDAMLGRIQNDLFDLGADLSTPEEPETGEALRISPEQVERLEAEIDTLNADLAPLTSFVLPGGSAAAAHLHQARTIVRRAERLIADLATREAINPQALAYANRLSDHLFVLARHCNERGRDDVLWQPGKNR